MTALALGIAVAVLWGFHDLIIRILSAGADVLACMLVVLLAGSICLLPLAFAGEAVPAWPGARSLALMALAGALLAVATRCLWGAFGAGPVRIVSPITAAYPVFSLAFAVVGGETVPALAWLATLGVIAGVGVVASGEADHDGPWSLHAAVAWSVGGALGYAATFALGQRIMATEAALPTLLIVRLAAAGVVALVMLGGGGLRWPARRSLPVLLAAGALDAVSLGLVFWAGRFDNASFATVTASLFGVVTILLAAVFLRERLTAWQWVGVGIVFAAVAVLGTLVK